MISFRGEREPDAPIRRQRDRELAALDAGASALDTIAAELFRMAASKTPEDPELARHADGCNAHASVLRGMSERSRHEPDGALYPIGETGIARGNVGA